MAGYSDAAFRSICTDWGAFLCFTEMVSAEALDRGSVRTLSLLQRAENERFLGVQIFASDPLSAVRALPSILPRQPDLIDLNCGCSVPKILKSGCGAALLREPARVAALVKAMREHSDVPVSVKIRSGWDSGSINFLEVAGRAEEAGASLVCLHPRTRAQGFSGEACLAHLKELKRRSRTLVFGSGDLLSAASALHMVRETGCDGVMLARGALGNPFIFTETRRLFAGEPAPPAPTVQERLATALRQLERAVTFKGEKLACREMRKQFCAYLRGMPGAARVRERVVRASTLGEYRTLVHDALEGGRTRPVP
jgi:tRNA-dihydrouridine synthase B